VVFSKVVLFYGQPDQQALFQLPRTLARGSVDKYMALAKFACNATSQFLEI
jgi:hypothetical protein